MLFLLALTLAVILPGFIGMHGTAPKITDNLTTEFTAHYNGTGDSGIL